MDKSFYELKLRQIDSALEPSRTSHFPPLPRNGWLSEVRRALRMSTSQLGRRLGITRQAVTAMEQAEADGSITLRSLRRAAEALRCDVVYALVPRESLESMVAEQARAVASAMVKRAAHSMALERQEVSVQESQAQVEDLADRLRSQWSRRLWDAVE